MKAFEKAFNELVNKINIGREQKIPFPYVLKALQLSIEEANFVKQS